MLPDGERGFSTKPERTCGHGLRSPSTIRAPKYDFFFDLHWCATQKHLQRCPEGLGRSVFLCAAGLLAVWSTNRFESVRGCASNLSLMVY
jgi:hypothetical protein